MRKSTALGSIALERMLDVLAIAALVLLGVAVEGAGGVDRSSLPVAHVAGLATVVIVAIVIGGILLSWLPNQWAATLSELLERLASGFAAVRRPRRMVSLFLWSLLIWSTNAAAFWVGFAAFHIDVPWTAAVVVQGTVTLGIALPSSPGFFGPFEAATRVALTSYGVAPAAAAAYGRSSGCGMSWPRQPPTPSRSI